MPNLPANIEAFCKVVDWRGFSTLLAGDADGIPDFTIIPGLTVTFTLNADSVKDVTASPSQGLALAVKPVSFIYDSDGYLVGANGVRGGYLIPTDDPDLNPTGMTYRVSWTVNGAPVIGPTGGVAFRTFDMAAPAGTTQDLVKLAPVPSSTGVSLNQAQAAEAAAVAAASAASAAAAAAAASAATFVPATVDTLGQATTLGKAIAKSSDQVAVRATIGAAVPTFVAAEDFVQVGDTSDDVFVQRALTFAKTYGIRKVKLTRNAYTFRRQMNFAGIYNVHLEGLGRLQTTITFTGTFADNAVQVPSGFTATGSGGGCGGLTFSDFTVQGTSVDDTNGIPRRSRTTTGGGGLSMAFRFTGDLTPLANGGVDSSLYVMRDITIRNVDIKNTNTLPLLLSGIRGEAAVRDSNFINTMDAGWVFCERVTAHNLTCINGADNGFSISRGNKSVVASNLRAENCAAYGIWLGGFLVNTNSTDYGSTNMCVSNISAINCAWGGVYLDEAPSNGVISGIYVNGVLRGTASGDFGDASAGTGVRIGGSPSNNLAGQVALATNLDISNMVLINCAKGGIIVSGAQDVTVRDALIINPGSATDYTGATVGSTSTSENFGVAAKPGSTSKITRFTAHNITVVDTRNTPVANYAIYLTGTTDAVWSGVRGVNTRQAVPHGSSVYLEHAGVINYNSIARYPAGTRIGQTGAAGLFTTVGPAGTNRSLDFATYSGSDLWRWKLKANGTAEGGSNVGSDFVIERYTDAGALSGTPLTIRRSDGRITAGAVVQIAAYTTGTRPSASTAGVGANVYDSTLSKPIWSDGTVWRDAAGTTV